MLSKTEMKTALVFCLEERLEMNSGRNEHTKTMTSDKEFRHQLGTIMLSDELRELTSRTSLSQS